MLFGCRAGNVDPCALLFVQHAVDEPARPERAGIDVQVVEWHPWVAVDRLLLGLQDRVVLIVDALTIVDVRPLKGASELLVLLPEGPDEVPEVMAGLLGLRCDRGQESAVDPLRAVALGGASSLQRHPDVAHDRGRGLEIDDLPPVDVTGPAEVLGPEGRRLDADHPTGDGRGPIRVRDLEGRARNRFVADAAGMDIGLVGQIHEVVDDEAVVAFEAVEGAALPDPVSSIVPMEIRYFGRIRERRVAGPYPHEAMSLGHWIGPNASGWIDGLLGRHEGAPARRVEHETMIPADHLIAL